MANYYIDNGGSHDDILFTITTNTIESSERVPEYEAYFVDGPCNVYKSATLNKETGMYTLSTLLGTVYNVNDLYELLEEDPGNSQSTYRNAIISLGNRTTTSHYIRFCWYENGYGYTGYEGYSNHASLINGANCGEYTIKGTGSGETRNALKVAVGLTEDGKLQVALLSTLVSNHAIDDMNYSPTVANFTITYNGVSKVVTAYAYLGTAGAYPSSWLLPEIAMFDYVDGNQTLTVTIDSSSIKNIYADMNPYSYYSLETTPGSGTYSSTTCTITFNTPDTDPVITITDIGDVYEGENVNLKFTITDEWGDYVKSYYIDRYMTDDLSVYWTSTRIKSVSSLTGSTTSFSYTDTLPANSQNKSVYYSIKAYDTHSNSVTTKTTTKFIYKRSNGSIPTVSHNLIPKSYDTTDYSYKSATYLYTGYQPHTGSGYAQLTLNTGSSAETWLYYKFNVPEIPENAEIISVQCLAKVYSSWASSSYSGYLTAYNVQLYAGSTPKGSPVSMTNSQYNPAVTLDTTDTWTSSDFDNLRLKIYLKRGTYATSSPGYCTFSGASLYITYVTNNVDKPVNSTVVIGGSTKVNSEANVYVNGALHPVVYSYVMKDGVWMPMFTSKTINAIWDRYRRTTNSPTNPTTYIQGAYFDTVADENSSAFPDNGIHTDGWWYVKK